MTLELAAALLVVGLVVAGCAQLLGLVMVQVRCADVAAQVAREVGRGDQEAATKATQQAPGGATVQVSKDQGWVSVTVTVRRSVGPVGPIMLSGQATARLESGDQP